MKTRNTDGNARPFSEAIKDIPNHNIPNAETIAVLNEYSEMKNNPAKYQRYPSFSALMKDVLSDI